MKDLPTQLDPRGHVPEGLAIPTTLHQTFKSSHVTDAMYAAAESWISLNPGFTYLFHDDAKATDFIGDQFGGRVADAFGIIEAGAFKADFWRYCILHEVGGVYADIDTVAVMPMHDLLEATDHFVSAASGPPRDFAVYNCFIASVPKHQFLAKCIERATEELLRRRRYDGYMVTGPGNLGQSMNLTLGRDLNTAHTAGRHEGEVPYRLLEKRIGDESLRRHLAWDGAPVLFTEYEDYKDDLDALGVRYWRDMPVYTGLAAQARKVARRLLGPFRR